MPINILYPQVNWTPALPESRSSLTAPLFKTISLLNIYQDHQLYSSMIKNGRAYLQAMKLLVISMPWHFHGNFVVLLYSKMCSGWVEQVCDCLNCCTWSLGHSAQSCPDMILKPDRANMICILCNFMIIEHFHEVYNCWLKASAMTAINMRMWWRFFLIKHIFRGN